MVFTTSFCGGHSKKLRISGYILSHTTTLQNKFEKTWCLISQRNDLSPLTQVLRFKRGDEMYRKTLEQVAKAFQCPQCCRSNKNLVPVTPAFVFELSAHFLSSSDLRIGLFGGLRFSSVLSFLPGTQFFNPDNLQKV